jgi:hypothetical protein
MEGRGAQGEPSMAAGFGQQWTWLREVFLTLYGRVV